MIIDSCFNVCPVCTYIELIVGNIEEAVSTVATIVQPFMEQIRDNQFSSTVQTAVDSALVLTVLIQDAAGKSDWLCTYMSSSC